MNALVRTLEEFGVKVIPGEIHTGPVITRYEVTLLRESGGKDSQSR